MITAKRPGKTARSAVPGNLLVAFYLLEFVGATAVAGLGWTGGRALGLACGQFLPLWWPMYLAVYNLDRLYADPADALNTPVRSAWSERLRPWRWGVFGASACLLAAWALRSQRHWVVWAAAVALAVLQFYSRPVPRFGGRLKDLPGLKSLLAPGAISLMLVAWPVWEARRPLGPREATVLAWCFLGLFINGLAFDLRDLEGDRRHGTKTLAVWLRPGGTRWLIRGLIPAFVALTALLADRLGAAPLVLAGLGGLALGGPGLEPGLSGMRLSVTADVFLLLPTLAGAVQEALRR
ncbi:MAG TPA: UbiA family prenyltransferase [Chthoniobacterales bacterium]